jgi:hypothetical protein
MWSLWWIFPLIGCLLFLAFFVLAFRFMITGRGFMCMGGHRAGGNDETAAMRREIHALREEIQQLKAAR